MSHEDQPVERSVGSFQDQEGLHPSPLKDYLDEAGVADPFALWAAPSDQPLAPLPTSETSTRRPGGRRTKSDPRSASRPVQQNRRKLVKLLAVGTVGIVTVVTVGGVSFARSPLSPTRSPSRLGDDQDEGSSSIAAHRERDDWEEEGRGKPPHKTPTPTKSPTPKPTPSPTKTPSPTATPPTATPTPSGTVIGSTTQATNTAVAFTNPADGQASWLVHMSNGNFVAVEQACTHAGVPVKYNASSGQFNCPAHGAIFNADGTNPQVPATRPLPPVHITVNANGTITVP
ncbi:MAG TPA: Rieske 2Fe-2S domain-containing protein [Ktedonobacteraceae bacterium]|nr:Rieske 2Fe-2S domain-containing protein [Ktedonobacteraceae bacterium]